MDTDERPVPRADARDVADHAVCFDVAVRVRQGRNGASGRCLRVRMREGGTYKFASGSRGIPVGSFTMPSIWITSLYLPTHPSL